MRVSISGSAASRCHGDAFVQLLYLKGVGAGLHRAGGGQQADVAGAGERADGFHRGADDTQYAPGGVQVGQVVLLDGAQGFGRGRVAGQDDQVAAPGEEVGDALQRVAVYHVERACAVGRAGVVAQVDVVVLRQGGAYLLQDGEASVAGVEHADGAGGGGVGGSGVHEGKLRIEN